MAAKFEIRSPNAGRYVWVLVSQGRILATSGEYLTGGGNVAQNFQGGTIHWGPNGNRISYK